MATKKEIRDLREALLDLTGVLNRPQPDAALIEAAGIDLDRALFPLLARIERRGPLGIVELAELAGRDYTTVSRQVAKLESLGLVSRCPSPEDGRVRAAIVTDEGRTMTRAPRMCANCRACCANSLTMRWGGPSLYEPLSALRTAGNGMGGCGSATARWLRYASINPLSIASVSASSMCLSVRQRSMRGNRTATPDL
jgi:DNA-binding MarR family transcriptional regulator